MNKLYFKITGFNASHLSGFRFFEFQGCGIRYNLIFLTICFLFLGTSLNAKIYTVQSPDKRLTAQVNVDETVTWSLKKDSKDILVPSEISMKTGTDEWIGKAPTVKTHSVKYHHEEIVPVLPLKEKLILNTYNELVIGFKGNYQLILRVYNEGAAYRWSIGRKGEVTIWEEEARFNFGNNCKIWFPEETEIYTHQERRYAYLELAEITPERFCSTGALVDLLDGRKVYISESDLDDYPGMFLQGGEAYGLKGKFSGYPLQTEQTSDRDVKVTQYAGYIAKTQGPRSFPWRVLVVSSRDEELIETELVFKLAKPQAIEDTQWIKPGKAAWDWWNDWNISGVDFRSGFNADTYKYYIDFASAHGLEYFVIDEGWYSGDLTAKKNIDMPAIVDYAKKKNVGIVLWVTWKALEDQMDEALKTFGQWGVKGIKVDFMQRDDQWMVNYYKRVAEKAACHKLLVDFHGSHKPTGLTRTFPNIVSYEGVNGLEQNKWGEDQTPEHDVLIPFIRMIAGPMDYTPGAMLNAAKGSFKPDWSKPMSQGTRCHQLAMYVVYESPLQMLADNPVHYSNEPECMEFLENVPTVWDQTKVLHARVGDYIAVARKNGDTWYIGGMTDWDARDLAVDFSFLEEGDYQLTLWKDGINANRNGMDYKKTTIEISPETSMDITLMRGGGFAGIIKRKQR